MFRNLLLAPATVVLFGLSACVDTVASEQEPVTPPEYLSCRSVPEALSYADAVVRGLSTSDTSAEAAYWRDRQERLATRAWECKGGK